MEKRILYFFTRTPLHVGAGASVGAIDQPVQRERHTGFPILPGSSIKGVLAGFFLDPTSFERTELGRQIFGRENPKRPEDSKAGRISFGEGKILAFPIRSARGGFAFITCPLALERFQREAESSRKLVCPREPEDMHCLAGNLVGLPKDKPAGVALEEYKFSLDGAFPSEWETALLGLLPEDPVWQAGKGRFVLLNNGDFSHFVRTACEVGQHVAIDPKKGTAKKGALFNLEAVPSETLFFSSLTCLPGSKAELDALRDFVQTKKVLQFGGDSTTGLGFCSVTLT